MKKKVLILFAAIITTSFAAGWIYSQKELRVEEALRQYLTDRGIENVKLEVSECGLYACKIPSISIGEDVLVTNLWAQYSPQSLYDKKLLLLQADSVDLIVRKNPNGISLGGIEKLAQTKNEQPTELTDLSIPLSVLLIGKLRLEWVDGQQRNHFTLDQISLSEDGNGSESFVAKIGNLMHDAEKPFFAPVTCDLSMNLANEMLHASGTIKGVSHNLTLELSGQYKPLTKSGNFLAELKPVVFETGVLQPDDILPILRGQFQHTRGTLSAALEFSLEGENTKQSGSLVMNNLRSEWQGGQIEGVEGKIKLRSLWPPLTDGIQTIKIQKVTAGIPLEKGQIVFALEKNNLLKLSPMKWSWSGGSLVTDAMETRWDKPTLDHIKLHIRQVDLQSLFLLVLDKGITATGKLDGTMPIRFRSGHILLDQASLQSTSAGVVKYKTEDNTLALSGGQNTEMLSKALEDFHFNILSMRIDSTEEGNATVALKVSGANPALYNGKAIELNVTLQGRLEEIIRQNMDAVSLPKQLEQHIKEQKP